MNETNLPSSVITHLFQTILTVLVLFGFGVQAQTFMEVLAYQSPEQLERLDQLLIAQQKQGFVPGFNATIGVTPSAFLTDTLNDEEGAGFNGNLGANLDLDYRFNAPQRLGNDRSVVRLEKDITRGRVNDAFTVMNAVAEYLRSELAIEVASNTLTSERDKLTAAEAAFDQGSGTRNDINQARLALERAELTLAQAQLRFNNATFESQRYGLTLPLVIDDLRFTMPDASITDTFAYQELEILIKEAEARLNTVRYLNTFEDLTFETGYSAPGIGTELSVGIIDKVPGANLSIDYPGASNPNWRLGMSAEINFDVNRLTTITEAEQRLVEAQADLSRYLERTTAELNRFREAAVLAEQSYLLSQQSLDLAKRKVVDLEVQLAEARAELTDATGDDVAAAEGNVESTERNLLREQANLLRAEDTVYLRWQSYFRQVREVLLRVEGDWSIRVGD